MYRPRIETLEKREMFAAATPSDAVGAWVLMRCPNDLAVAQAGAVGNETATDAGGDSAALVFLHSNGLMTSVKDRALADPFGAVGATTESAMASLLASNEYFARFTNTRLDDESLTALRNGQGGRAVTHDAEFEDWARISRFDRGYLSPG